MNHSTPGHLPFRWGWYFIGLGAYRPKLDDGKYTLYSYEHLPPLPEERFTGTFQWLEPQKFFAWDPKTRTFQETLYAPEHHGEGDAQRRAREQWENHERELMGRLPRLVSSAQHLGLSLPDAFLKFMASKELRDRIPSCTGCYFDLPREIIPCPGCEQGHIIRFLDDQQGNAFWYLYLTPQGEQCVLASLEELDDPHPSLETILEYTVVCAPSFEAFLYRFWIEDNSTNPPGTQQMFDEEYPFLSKEERHYLLHYLTYTNKEQLYDHAWKQQYDQAKQRYDQIRKSLEDEGCLGELDSDNPF